MTANGRVDVPLLPPSLMNPYVVSVKIDHGAAEGEKQRGEKMWSEAGDDGGKYDEANEITREADAELASAEGKG